MTPKSDQPDELAGTEQPFVSHLIELRDRLVRAAIAVGVWGVAGFGMGLAYAPLSVTMLDLAEPGREGDASASLQLHM